MGATFQGAGIYKLLHLSIWEESKSGISNTGTKREFMNLELLNVCSKTVECYTSRLECYPS